MPSLLPSSYSLREKSSFPHLQAWWALLYDIIIGIVYTWIASVYGSNSDQVIIFLIVASLLNMYQLRDRTTDWSSWCYNNVVLACVNCHLQWTSPPTCWLNAVLYNLQIYVDCWPNWCIFPLVYYDKIKLSWKNSCDLWVKNMVQAEINVIYHNVLFALID